MCMGSVESCEKSGNFREISLNKAIKTYRVLAMFIGGVSL